MFEAVALKGMMEALMLDGCIMVMTSNKPPWELNQHGLHEDMFLYFVNRLVDVCDTMQLGSGVDYRSVPLPFTFCINSSTFSPTFSPKNCKKHSILCSTFCVQLFKNIVFLIKINLDIIGIL